MSIALHRKMRGCTAEGLSLVFTSDASTSARISAISTRDTRQVKTNARRIPTINKKALTEQGPRTSVFGITNNIWHLHSLSVDEIQSYV